MPTLNLKFYPQHRPNSGAETVYDFFLQPADVVYRGITTSNVSNRYWVGTDDAPNDKYLTYELAVSAFMALALPAVLSAINTALGTSFTVGSIITLDQNLQDGFDSKAAVSHTHVANDITDATSIGKSVLTSADAAAVRTAIGAGTSNFNGTFASLTGKPIVQTTVADAATNAANNAATNAPTNLNVLTTLLGALTGEVNATNSKQNDLAAKYNDLATKTNDMATKFNSLLDIALAA